ncbi:rap/ran-GAP domain-containing protein [Ditylenchus destructor]|uniref:Rap/ran-GAP domain-containing protein n=1 Tax=Ditylenchus destructor TaxID=166010 RepID=A0AAD4R3U0_9BILA|nr:rap/ran-GAP domain-containing protein [Ditylenchus destructor]
MQKQMASENMFSTTEGWWMKAECQDNDPTEIDEAQPILHMREYRTRFCNKIHYNFYGINTKSNPADKVVVSVINESTDIKLLYPIPASKENILNFDETNLSNKRQFSFTIFHQRESQKESDSFYRNTLEPDDKLFSEFLEMLGEWTQLKGFNGYAGRLDTKNDTTGTHSVQCQFQKNEIMFHIASIIRTEGKEVTKKDIVAIVFQQEPTAFSPDMIKDHPEIHVIVVVTTVNPYPLTYHVRIFAKNNVPASNFETLPKNSVFCSDARFRDYFLSLLINSECAAYRADSYSISQKRAEKMELLYRTVEVPELTVDEKTQTFKLDLPNYVVCIYTKVDVTVTDAGNVLLIKYKRGSDCRSLAVGVPGIIQMNMTDDSSGHLIVWGTLKMNPSGGDMSLLKSN